jgi:hypothetical protein
MRRLPARCEDLGRADDVTSRASPFDYRQHGLCRDDSGAVANLGRKLCVGSGLLNAGKPGGRRGPPPRRGQQARWERQPLGAERVALDFLGHRSDIATATYVSGTHARRNRSCSANFLVVASRSEGSGAWSKITLPVTTALAIF